MALLPLALGDDVEQQEVTMEAGMKELRENNSKPFHFAQAAFTMPRIEWISRNRRKIPNNGNEMNRI